MDTDSSGTDFQPNFGFDGPTDNDVSTMVDQYLMKMSLAGSTTSSQNIDNPYAGMQYTDPDSSTQHIPDSPSEPLQPQIPLQQSYGNYQPSSHSQYTHPDQTQYMPSQHYQSLHHDQFQSRHISQSSVNPMDYYSMPHQQQQGNMLSINHDPFGQTSPVYYVAQSVQNIPLHDQPHQNPTFNYENYATMPLPRISTSSTHGLQQATQRNRSTSSAGNSPSSQSPVSEEDFSEPPPKSVPRRPSKDAGPTKKPKQMKPRRRKRDPNEPTKPVSAYALFFRDKQATIKGTKPDASFGEVSKIVAHMWDNLEPEKKSMYKKRTEEAKKDYLQQIAVYRASLVSSSSDPTLYIQTNFMSRSPTLQIPNYNSRQIYSSIANQAQHQHQHHHQHNHKTLNHHSGHTGNHASPLRLVQETDCMQLAPLLTDGDQAFSRLRETEMSQKNSYAGHMQGIWEPQVVTDEDCIVTHCKDILPNEWISHQAGQTLNSTKVVI